MSLRSTSLAQCSFLKLWTTTSVCVIDYPQKKAPMSEEEAPLIEDLGEIEEECFESPTKKPKLGSNFMEILSDEILLDILLTFIPDAITLARVSGVNKRLRKMLCEERAINQLLDQRVDSSHRDLFVRDTGLSPLEELGFYQFVKEKGLFEENRIGFDFASVDVDDDSGENSLIKNSTSRIDALGGILERFENARLVIEAHCGTAAPPGVAHGFSRARGQVVSSEVFHSDHNITNLSERITTNPWGRRVAQRASSSNHKHGELARQGRGWVDTFLVLGDSFELPRRPEYYSGMRMIEEEEEPVRVIRILW